MIEDSILWRRLDTPGHDVCRLFRDRDGWVLEGRAVFRQACLSYRVTCDRSWRTRRGHVRGWLAREHVLDLVVERRSSGVWTLGGTPVPGLESCVDLDLGFTPATNLLPIRRLALEIGEAAGAPAAWLDPSRWTLECLGQRYERNAESTYAYEAPSLAFAARLEVAPNGFVLRYPRLWEAEGPSRRVIGLGTY